MANLNLRNGSHVLSNDPHLRKLGFTETKNLDAEDIFVCLPGLLETRNTFKSFFESAHCDSKIRMICIDYCGRGDSDLLQSYCNYSMSRYISDIEDFLQNYVFKKHKNKDARLHLIGTSMGGILALYLIEKLNNKLDSVVLNDIGLKVEWAALAKLNKSIDSQLIEINASKFESKVIIDVKAPSHFDLPYQFDLIGINLAHLVQFFEGRIVLIHNSNSLMCPTEIAEFSKRKFKSIEVKTIDAEGHPVAWSLEIAKWVLNNLAIHKSFTH
jgi:pimeloyl-ACP methyl ester carboxylesterase